MSETIRFGAVDLNGQARGKRVPASYAEKLESGQARLPLSVLNVDLWGEDIEDSPLVFKSGDRDGILRPSPRGPLALPWIDRPSALWLMRMHLQSGEPFEGCPQRALGRVLERYAAKGWRVEAAFEMEFHLLDDEGGTLASPISPRTGRRVRRADVNSLLGLDAFDDFFTDLYDGCEDMGIPAEAAISEAGVGQFELSLTHEEASRAAESAWAFKQLARGLARRHDMAASFMAKPFEDDSGNGLHVHFSVLDEEGRNVFDDGSEQGNDLLRSAVAGCLNALPSSMLVFAPHANSYERLVPGAHAPVQASWAYENRTAAIRIPAGPGKARRIEHRVAGGDANPFLHLAAVLGAALNGIEAGLVPPEPIKGNAYEQDLPELPTDWASAIDAFDESPEIAEIFHPRLIDCFTRTKRQELKRCEGMARDDLVLLCLETV